MRTMELDTVQASIDQHHEYLRHTIQQLIAWYTFFITANIVTGGWFVLAILDDNVEETMWLFGFVSFVFVLANGIAIFINILVRRSTQDHVKKIEKLLATREDISDIQISDLVAAPKDLYGSIPLGIIATLVPLMLLWIVVPVYSVLTRVIVFG